MPADPRLEPLRADEIAHLIASGIATFADELTEAGMVRDAALDRAQRSYDESFPGGVPAPGHLALALRDGGTLMAWVWLGPADGEPSGSWWVYDVEVVEEHRGRGWGRTVMELAELEVRDRGGTSLGLNVFGPNHVARRLYESLGYEPTSIRMRKDLDPPAEPD